MNNLKKRKVIGLLLMTVILLQVSMSMGLAREDHQFSLNDQDVANPTSFDPGLTNNGDITGEEEPDEETHSLYSSPQ